jgi:hypothetical protein
LDEIPEAGKSSDLDRHALEALMIDNPDLERLEALLDQFNIFEALGAVRQELRHSDFLAFLLNPQQNHGLGDIFLKRLLQKTLPSGDSTSVPITPIDLDIWSLDELLVMREWQNIDILLLDKPHKLAIIIENKIDSSEHSNQLQRYRQIVHEQYPDWSIIGLYLTPNGESSSDESYLPISYTLVCQLLEGLARSRASTLGPDVLTAITHYTQMLRRHIVGESEIAELCRRIYQKHQRALDLIYEYRPDQQAVIRDILEGMVKQIPGMILDYSSKSAIRFALSEWDVPMLMNGKGWTPSGRILLFEFSNEAKSLKLKLILGPGPQEIRQELFTWVLQHGHPFRSPYKNKLYEKWHQIYDHSFLTAESYQDAGDDKIAEEIKKQWAKFLENSLPLIRESLGKWIKEMS